MWKCRVIWISQFQVEGHGGNPWCLSTCLHKLKLNSSLCISETVHSWLCSPQGAAPCRCSLLPGSCRCPGLWEAPWGGVAEQWGGHWQGQVAPAQPGCSGPSREGTRNQRWFFVCSEAVSRQTAPSAAVVPSLLPVQHSAIHCCHLSQQWGGDPGALSRDSELPSWVLEGHRNHSLNTLWCCHFVSLFVTSFCAVSTYGEDGNWTLPHNLTH